MSDQDTPSETADDTEASPGADPGPSPAAQGDVPTFHDSHLPEDHRERAADEAEKPDLPDVPDLSEDAQDDSEELRKAESEAKRNTSWTHPNNRWLEAGERFLNAILSPDTGKEFLESFRPRAARVAHLGMVNSLAQTALKITSPVAASTHTR